MKKLNILFFLVIGLNAGAIDAPLESTCKDVIKGNTPSKYQYEVRGYLTGIVAGFDYTLPANKQKKISQGDIRYEACRRALDSGSTDGFENRYKKEAYNYSLK